MILTLDELATLLDAYARGQVSVEALHKRLVPVLLADPFTVETSESAPWEHSPADARLFWRLVYFFETAIAHGSGSDAPQVARRVVTCLRRTGSAETTFELLPLILDQDRLALIVGRHTAGLITRTGFLSVVAESSYPAHVKLWLEHAGEATLSHLVERFVAEEYERVAVAVESPPA